MPYNEKSLENLTHHGKPWDYNEPKKKRELTVTNTGWNSAKARVKALGYKSVSQFLEEFGRGTINLG